MASNVSAFYHWPAIWIGGEPPTVGEEIDVSAAGEEAYRTIILGRIAVRVLREGMFIFDFSEWGPGQAPPSDDRVEFDTTASVLLQRAAAFNAYLACFYTALSRQQRWNLEKMVVSPLDLIRFSSFEEPSSMGFGGNPIVAALALTRYRTTYVLDLPTSFDWRVFHRSVNVEIATVEESFQLLEDILQHPAPHALQVTDLYTRSCKAHEDHNYALCLVTAWAITEKLLQRLWERCVESNRERNVEGERVTFINRTRKEKLTESRDFNASVISEILSLTDSLPFSLYQDMSRVRQARNDWIHGLEPVSREIAKLSVSVAEQMLSLVEAINLQVPLVSHISGL